MLRGFLVVVFIVGCAGRPAFTSPACENLYDECVTHCEVSCPPSPEPAVEPLYEDVQVECASCVNVCRESALECER